MSAATPSCSPGDRRIGARDDGPWDRAESAQPVAAIPHREECRRLRLPPDEDRWRCYLDTGDELVFYCPHCAAREFDDD